MESSREAGALPHAPAGKRLVRAYGPSRPDARFFLCLFSREEKAKHWGLGRELAELLPRGLLEVPEVIGAVLANDKARLHRRVEVAPEAQVDRAAERGDVRAVVDAAVLLDVRGRLLGAVEGHVGEEMVANVRVRDVVQPAVVPRAHGAVEGGKGAAQPGPLLVVIVRHQLVRVLHEGDAREVHVHNHLGDEIDHRDLIEAVHLARVAEDSEHGDHATVGRTDLPLLLWREKTARLRVKVRLALVLARASVVVEEVEPPADGPDERNAEDRALVRLEPLRLLAVRVSRRRHPRLAICEVVGAAVVLGVRDLPRVVGCE
mmetsp:Transcript_31553/g.78835  ORF Transcript_31553/g.78835 Transcript_31553/m.78835 type:complete len:318 (-) Transcript_31553:2981-3934(-)